MELGAFEIPEVPLFPECIQLAKTIYDAIGSDGITSLDLAKALGYATNTTNTFYRRLNSMVAYGMLEKRGKYFVTDLGKELAYPESESNKKQLVNKAIFSVPLWSELYKKYGRNPADENFWVGLKSITGVESPVAQKHQGYIRKRYVEDIAQLSEEVEEPDVEPSQSPQSLSLTSGSNSIKGMMAAPQLAVSEELETFAVGKIVIQLPKADLKKSWEKAKRMMDIYVEDYEAVQLGLPARSKVEETPTE